MPISGQQGSLMWAYHTAAAVRDWTITNGELGRTLSARLEKTDSFRVSQRPLTFVATHANRAWRWPITTLQITGATLTAVLGPREL
jgi:hypothetical protein